LATDRGYQGAEKQHLDRDIRLQAAKDPRVFSTAALRAAIEKGFFSSLLARVMRWAMRWLDLRRATLHFLVVVSVAAGCAPRATLTPVSDSLTPIAAAFNAAAEKPRVVALFSPT
jgi:hypothetical protein